MASKRFLMVPEDSSAARMPLPGATMARATLFSSSTFIALSDLTASQSFYSQDLDPRQGLTLQPLQEGPAGCGYIGQAIGDAGDIERRHRVAAARDRHEFSGGGQFG